MNDSASIGRVVPEQRKEIPSAIEEMRKETVQLEDTLLTLRDMLMPVLRSEVREGSKKVGLDNGNSYFTKMALEIEANTISIRNLRSILVEIMNALEI